MEIEKPNASSVQPENSAPARGESGEVKVRYAGKRFIVIGSVLAALVLTGLGLTATVYLQPPTSSSVRAITSVIPFPAAVVGWDVITIREYVINYDALMMAQAAAETPAAADIEVTLMDMLINKQAIRQVAKREGIVLDEARVEKLYQDLLATRASKEALDEELKTALGWSVDDFMDRVIRPFALAEQVSEHVMKNAALQAETRSRIDAALARLNAGEDFTAVAGTTNPIDSAATGGKVGFVKLSEMPEEWRAAVQDVAVGSYSPVVDAPFDYFILMVNDRVQAGDDTQIDLSAIYIPKRTLQDVTDEYLEQTRVVRLFGKG